MTLAGPVLDLVPGAVIDGKLRIERALGRGGMGVVVEAQHLQLDTRVAIKFLHPELLSDPEVVARFAREARAAVKITSEHVARVLDVGALDSGAPYIVMEFLEGRDLASWLRASGPLPVEQAVEFVLHACDALAEAHAHGIVHRDLKPSNLFCIRRADGQLAVKVLDFGISKLGESRRGDGMPGVTRTVTLMGTPFYMAPEQMKSAKSADAQSDIWALGVILYELLSGRVPFHGDAITEIAVLVATSSPAPLREAREDVPRDLEAVVMRCLEKNKARRYSSVAHLAVALQPFAPKRAHACVERILGIARSERSVDTLTAPADYGVSTVAASETSSPFSASMHSAFLSVPRSRRTVGVAVGIALIVVAAAVTGIVALFGSPPSVGGAARAPTAAALSAPVAGIPVATAVAAPSPRAPADVFPIGAGANPATELPEGTDRGASPRGPAAGGSPLNGQEAGTHRPTPVAHPARAPRPIAPPARGTALEPATAGAPQAAPSAVAAPAVSPPACDPPYTLDNQGRKRFKPECFLNR